jgi:hypothetical protein
MEKPSKMNKATGFLEESIRGCYCTSYVNAFQGCVRSSEGVAIHFLSLPHLYQQEGITQFGCKQLKPL